MLYVTLYVTHFCDAYEHNLFHLRKIFNFYLHFKKKQLFTWMCNYLQYIYMCIKYSVKV